MPPEPSSLRFGPLTRRDLHVCVDMQRLFAEETDWHTPWMTRVLPNVLKLVRAHPDRTLFTRFVPPHRSTDVRGTWVRYYERWASMTIEKLGPAMVDLVPDLARFVPPGEVFDKDVYSPWLERGFERRLEESGAESIVVSGGETDVCVLATVLGAVDRGYRVVVATDALCSSSDAVHDAALDLYNGRYGQQVEAVSTDAVLDAWDA